MSRLVVGPDLFGVEFVLDHPFWWVRVRGVLLGRAAGFPGGMEGTVGFPETIVVHLAKLLEVFFDDEL